MSEGKFDGLFLTVAQQHTGGVEELMDTFFGFLERKTDFFLGAAPEQAEQLLLRSFHKHRDISLQKKKERDAEAERRRKREEEKRQKEEQKRREELDRQRAEPKIVELPDDDAAPAPAPAAAPAAEAKGSEKKEGDEAEAGEGEDGEKDDKKYQKPNAGNGGSGPGYSWVQTLNDLEVRVELPRAVKSKELVCSVTHTHLKVELKGHGVLLEGELWKKVTIDDWMQTLEDEGKTAVIYLSKGNKVEWWNSVIKGHPEINLQKVSPENGKVEDLDSETQQTVRKMMFDQQQRARGLPTSDEQQKKDILAKFMKAHPEMDFSNAKMC